MIYMCKICSKSFMNTWEFNSHRDSCTRKLKQQRDDLLAACELALPLIAGERIKFDAIPRTHELEKHLASLIRECEKVLDQAIAKANKK